MPLSLNRAPLPPLPAGVYIMPMSSGGQASNGGLGTNSLRLVPWVVEYRLVIDRIGAEIVTVGDAGSKLRPGLYRDNGASYPGALLLDPGTIAGDSATVQDTAFTGPLVLAPGVYWTGGVVQVVTTTQPAVRVNATWNPPITIPLLSSLPAAALGAIGFSTSGVSGALPDPFPAPAAAGLVGVAPRVHLRTA